MKRRSRDILSYYPHRHIAGEYYLVRNYTRKAKKFSLWRVMRIGG